VDCLRIRRSLKAIKKRNEAAGLGVLGMIGETKAGIPLFMESPRTPERRRSGMKARKVALVAAKKIDEVNEVGYLILH